MSERPLRVMLADDHAATRAEMREILEADPRFEICGEAADAPTAIAIASAERPDICLLDIRMPGNGIAAAWEITAQLPGAAVVMLTVSDSDTDLFAALRAGALGYLLKDMDPRRIPDSLVDVVEGKAAIPRTLVTRMVEAFRDASPRRRPVPTDQLGARLTRREWEVLDLLRRGHETSEIADRLSLTPATVRSHVAAILRKLRVPDRESAIRLFERGE